MGRESARTGQHHLGRRFVYLHDEVKVLRVSLSGFGVLATSGRANPQPGDRGSRELGRVRSTQARRNADITPPTRSSDDSPSCLKKNDERGMKDERQEARKGRSSFIIHP